MKQILKKRGVWLFVAVAVVLGGCGQGSNSPTNFRCAARSAKCNAIYYWKTTFDIDSAEMSFLRKHDIKRLYLRMFDVVVEQNYLNGTQDIVPIATTKFKSALPDTLDIVPVTYITIDALRAMAGREAEFGALIAGRLLAMSSYNGAGKIGEIQLDCDWTESTKESYNRLCRWIRDSLHSRQTEISVTVRLHQLRETPPPADRGVLMLYNTGALKDPRTKNSILDPADAAPYLKKAKKYPLPLDYAYPVFGWGVKFQNDKFVSIVSADTCAGNNTERIRYERPAPAEIQAVRTLVEEHLGKPARGNILYHLDDTQLKNYTDDEIAQILAY